MTYNVISGDCHIDLGWLQPTCFLAMSRQNGKTKCPRSWRRTADVYGRQME